MCCISFLFFFQFLLFSLPLRIPHSVSRSFFVFFFCCFALALPPSLPPRDCRHHNADKDEGGKKSEESLHEAAMAQAQAAGVDEPKKKNTINTDDLLAKMVLALCLHTRLSTRAVL